MGNQVMKHMELLGLQVQDKVSGMEGIATSLSFDLYGCVQALVAPKADGSKLESSFWFDVTRLTVKSKKPVMEIPDFSKGYISEGKKVCAFKPAQ